MIFTVLYLSNYKYKEINNKNKINITTVRICTSGNNGQKNGSVDWIHVVQDRTQGQDLVNMEIEFQVL
jgi:hypothetical protein